VGMNALLYFMLTPVWRGTGRVSRVTIPVFAGWDNIINQKRLETADSRYENHH